MLPSLLLGALLPLGLIAVGAVLADGGRHRRALAVAVAALGLPLTWLSPPLPLFRAILAITIIWGCFRVYELARGPATPLSRRLFHALAFVDSRRIEARPPALPGRQLLRALLFAPLAAAGLGLALVIAPRVAGHGGLVVRWAGGLVFAYGLTEVVYALIWTSYRVRGQLLPVLHRDPILSRSVGELWGARWNLTVGRWLREHCFRPLARRGHPRAGIALAFAVSAVLHTYFALLPLGPAMAVCMLAFFALQGVLVLAESALRIAHWPAAAARTWFAAVMILASPLFIEPLLRIVAP
jgi:hypothetical protein